MSYSNLTELFTATADAIRAKTGSAEPIVANAFPAAIEGMPAGGGGGNNFKALVERTIESVSDNTVETIGRPAFQACESLKQVNFLACKSVMNEAFFTCYSLSCVSLPSCTLIGMSAFYQCYNLISFNLLGSTICKLSRSDAFRSTPIGGYSASAGQLGSIFVPASLLTAYQSATNWAYFSERFVGV